MKSCHEMTNEDWDKRFAGRCYFYPGRDCPSWTPGTACGRIGRRIPTIEDKENANKPD